jgi:hypothetical protein
MPACRKIVRHHLGDELANAVGFRDVEVIDERLELGPRGFIPSPDEAGVKVA